MSNISTFRLFSHLEEIILEEVSHGLVGGDGPPGVEVEVENVEPGDQDQGRELGFVSDRDKDHQEGADKVLNNLEFEDDALPGNNISTFTCIADISNLRRVRNMKTRRILPASCKYILGLFSPRLGTPAKRDLPSTRDSARTRSRAPIRARFLKRNWRSHKML